MTEKLVWFQLVVKFRKPTNSDPSDEAGEVPSHQPGYAQSLGSENVHGNCGRHGLTYIAHKPWNKEHGLFCLILTLLRTLRIGSG